MKALCKEYRKKTAKDPNSVLDSWEAVLIISIEEHPLYGQAEYFCLVGHPHGYSIGGLADRIEEYTRLATPSDKYWKPIGKSFDLVKHGFSETPHRSYNINVRWKPTVKTTKIDT